MNKSLIAVIYVSLLAIVTNLFAGNDTVSFVEYYSCDFEDISNVNQWQIKSSTGKNKWIINSYDGNNTCLYISENSQDTTYAKKSSSVSLAYKKIFISSADSLQIEFDANIGGEGKEDYLKVMLLPEDFDFTLPSPSASNLGFAGAYYRDSSFLFEDGNAYFSGSDGWQHIKAKKRNTDPCSEAYLVFVWRNDNSSGTMPGAIVDNISVKGIVKQVNKSLCKGEYFSVGNKNVNESGTYYDTVAIDGKCDSIVQYNVVVYDTFIRSVDIELCNGENYVLNDGTIITNTGIYVENPKTEYGCDSIIYVNLTVKPDFFIEIYDTVCSNEQYSKNGFDVSTAGSYFDTLKAQNGCDSIVNLLLTVNNTYENTYIEMICTGEIFDKYGFNESSSGFYTQNLQTVNGCDSIVHLNLSVADTIYKNIYDTVCEGEVYSQNGFTATEDGIYIDSLQTINGCDSIVILHLTVNPTNLQKDTSDIIEICQGESVEFCGKTLTTSGYYEETLQNIYGCDSIVHITLVVNPVYWVTDSVTINNGEQYVRNGKTYSQEGTYIDTLTSSNGCDSIVTLCLTVTSSLMDIATLQNTVIYPNPVKERFYINLQPSANKTVICMIDEAGIKKKSIQVPANQQEIMIDVSDMPKGVYLLQIYNDGIITEKKVVIQ